MSIQVHPQGLVEVVVPRHLGVSRVRAFVDDHRAWIEHARRKLGVTDQPPVMCLPQRIDLRFIECSRQVSHLPGRMAPRLRERGQLLEITGGEPEDARIYALLQRWLREQGRQALVPRLQELARESGLEFRSAQVRLQRTRWGSCSSRKSISLNASALFVEPRLVDYLLLHELAHTRHMNHSPRFWALLESLAPGARAMDRELNGCWRQVPPWLFRRQEAP